MHNQQPGLRVVDKVGCRSKSITLAQNRRCSTPTRRDGQATPAAVQATSPGAPPERKKSPFDIATIAHSCNNQSHQLQPISSRDKESFHRLFWKRRDASGLVQAALAGRCRRLPGSRQVSQSERITAPATNFLGAQAGGAQRHVRIPLSVPVPRSCEACVMARVRLHFQRLDPIRISIRNSSMLVNHGKLEVLNAGNCSGLACAGAGLAFSQSLGPKSRACGWLQPSRPARPFLSQRMPMLQIL